ncbi:cell division protein ZapA [Hyphococcus sp.]|uniref:cell division protein ZapA n=1 Tax=Hyphococcus sp. TaxID=2038636 RepID=UPI003D10C647
MSQVEIKVHGREYRVTCETGQEDRLQKLAAFLDKRVSAMSADLPDISETRLMLLAALTICDELFEARERAEDLEDAGDALDEETMGGAARAVEAAAKRVKEMAEKLDS